MGVVSSFCFPWDVSKRHIDQYFPAFIGDKSVFIENVVIALCF